MLVNLGKTSTLQTEREGSQVAITCISHYYCISGGLEPISMTERLVLITIFVSVYTPFKPYNVPSHLILTMRNNEHLFVYLINYLTIV
jgi:hypothetical protein